MLENISMDSTRRCRSEPQFCSRLFSRRHSTEFDCLMGRCACSRCRQQRGQVCSRHTQGAREGSRSGDVTLADELDTDRRNAHPSACASTESDLKWYLARARAEVLNRGPGSGGGHRFRSCCGHCSAECRLETRIKDIALDRFGNHFAVSEASIAAASRGYLARDSWRHAAVGNIRSLCTVNTVEDGVAVTPKIWNHDG